MSNKIVYVANYHTEKKSIEKLGNGSLLSHNESCSQRRQVIYERIPSYTLKSVLLFVIIDFLNGPAGYLLVLVGFSIFESVWSCECHIKCVLTHGLLSHIL